MGKQLQTAALEIILCTEAPTGKGQRGRSNGKTLNYTAANKSRVRSGEMSKEHTFQSLFCVRWTFTALKTARNNRGIALEIALQKHAGILCILLCILYIHRVAMYIEYIHNLCI